MNSSHLLDLQASDRETEGRIWRDTPGREALRAVAFVTRDQNLPLLVDLHAKHPLIPTYDDLSNSGLVLEGLLARILRVPELFRRIPVQCPERVHRYLVPLGDTL